MSFFIRALNGGEKLWKVTWLGYLGGTVALTLLFVLSSGLVGETSGVVFAPLVVLLNVWGLVSIWRCAGNVGWRGWFYLARFAVLFTATMWVLEIAGILPDI